MHCKYDTPTDARTTRAVRVVPTGTMADFHVYVHEFGQPLHLEFSHALQHADTVTVLHIWGGESNPHPFGGGLECMYATRELSPKSVIY
jgi:hypothetical protein